MKTILHLAVHRYSDTGLSTPLAIALEVRAAQNSSVLDLVWHQVGRELGAQGSQELLVAVHALLQGVLLPGLVEVVDAVDVSWLLDWVDGDAALEGSIAPQRGEIQGSRFVVREEQVCILKKQKYRGSKVRLHF